MTARIEQAEDFNARVPVGTPVRYWPVRGELDRYHDTVTRSVAWTLGDGTPVVLLENHVCAVDIDHVRVLPAQFYAAKGQMIRDDELADAVKAALNDARARGLEEAAGMAAEIAADLFVNGAGQHADRLVLVAVDGRDLGGWCEGAARDRIADRIRACAEVVRKGET